MMWASAFVSARVIVTYMASLYALSLRFVISAIFALGIAFVFKQKINFTQREWIAIILFAIAQNSIYLGSNFVALKTVDASTAALISSTMPLFVATISVFCLKQPFSFAGWLGLIAGFAGVACLVGVLIIIWPVHLVLLLV